jgi:phage terminase small subunit
MSKEKLTQKQQAFLRAYLGGKDPSQAYAQAYDIKTMSPKAISVEAAKLLNHPVIALAVQNFHKKEEVRTLLTLEEHMEELRKLREEARINGQTAAAIKAEELRGKLRRFYVEQVEVGEAGDFRNMSDDDLDAQIAQEMAALDSYTTH